jgi:4-amino-4-deoxy-L-arabinose transferase-like glycosyltransferase
MRLGLLLFGLVALPWYAIVIHDTPGLLDYYLGVELIDRLTEPELARHGEWYGWLQVYAPTLLLGTLPWSTHLWRWLRSLGSQFRAWRMRDSRQDDRSRIDPVRVAGAAAAGFLPVAFAHALVPAAAVHTACLDRRTPDAA